MKTERETNGNALHVLTRPRAMWNRSSGMKIGTSSSVCLGNLTPTDSEPLPVGQFESRAAKESLFTAGLRRLWAERVRSLCYNFARTICHYVFESVISTG
jgi:hypothetical protein